MYGLVRAALAVIIFFAAFALIKITRSEKQKEFILFAFSFSVFVAVVLSPFPFENAFYTFDSADAAFKYTERTGAELTIEGKTTELVIGGRDRMTILQKTKDGRKLARKANIKTVSSEIKNDISVSVYRYNTSDDYYIVIHGKMGEPLYVRDNIESEVFDLTRDSKTVKDGVTTYYMTVHDPTLKYRLTVDDTDFFIIEE